MYVSSTVCLQEQQSLFQERLISRLFLENKRENVRSVITRNTLVNPPSEFSAVRQETFFSN